MDDWPHIIAPLIAALTSFILAMIPVVILWVRTEIARQRLEMRAAENALAAAEAKATATSAKVDAALPTPPQSAERLRHLTAQAEDAQQAVERLRVETSAARKSSGEIRAWAKEP